MEHKCSEVLAGLWTTLATGAMPTEREVVSGKSIVSDAQQ